MIECYYFRENTQDTSGMAQPPPCGDSDAEMLLSVGILDTYVYGPQPVSVMNCTNSLLIMHNCNSI